MSNKKDEEVEKERTTQSESAEKEEGEESSNKDEDKAVGAATKEEGQGQADDEIVIPPPLTDSSVDYEACLCGEYDYMGCAGWQHNGRCRVGGLSQWIVKEALEGGYWQDGSKEKEKSDGKSNQEASDKENEEQRQPQAETKEENVENVENGQGKEQDSEGGAQETTKKGNKKKKMNMRPEDVHLVKLFYDGKISSTSRAM